jgi:hypothetical protein
VQQVQKSARVLPAKKSGSRLHVVSFQLVKRLACIVITPLSAGLKRQGRNHMNKRMMAMASAVALLAAVSAGDLFAAG